MADHRAPPSAVLVALDAFKGTASAATVVAAAAEGARRAGWVVDECSLSDGGEGFAEVVAAAPPGGGRWRTSTVTGPLGRPVQARWYQRAERALVESAAASGLPLAGGPHGNDPVAATSRGTGELIVAAWRAGARSVLVGVGGSATTDGGSGAIEAVEEAGGWADAEVVVACDVRTTFLDAADVFGPQKGATPSQVVVLRRRLAELARAYRLRYGLDVTTLVGGGAAGGLAGGLAACGARLAPGFEVVAGAVDLDGRLARAGLVVTGEGRLDASSWEGKVVGGVVGRARAAGLPVLVVAGTVGPGGVEPLDAPDRQGGASVLSLVERFGEGRARRDPARCVAAVVEEALSGAGGDLTRQVSDY